MSVPSIEISRRSRRIGAWVVQSVLAAAFNISTLPISIMPAQQESLLANMTASKASSSRRWA